MAIKLAFIFISFLLYSTYANEEIEETPSIARFALGHLFGCSADELLNTCLENQAVETVRSLKEDYKTSIDKYVIKARRISKRMKTDSSEPEAQEVTKLQQDNEDLIEKIRGKESKPNGLLDEISDLFTYGVAKVLGYFTNDKQTDDDLTEKIILQADGRSADEARGHKKKYLKKQNKHLKLILLVMLFKNKVKMFVHKLQFLVQLKFLGIAVVNLLINLVRLWLELKKKHKPHKVVYYENAHHQHHYDHEHLHEHDDGHYSHPGSHSHHSHHEEEYGGGSWPWSRSYIEKQSEQAFATINSNNRPNYPAQNLVYLKQRPVR